VSDGDLGAERAARIERAMERLRGHDPEWAELFRVYVLDGMYEREVIDQKTRELCAVAALTVLDRPGPLQDHMKGAFRNGATMAEVLEVVLQASVYGGFPVTLSAIGHLEAVVEELGIDS
jgi:4-carboxymuconolactone decarboxylase